MPEGKQVEFSGIVLSQLPTKCADNLRKDLPLVFSGLCPTAPSPARILVSRLFKGYTQNFDEQIILGLEVQYNDHRYETHIVKIGKRDKVKKDHDGWMSCTKDRQVASRILRPCNLWRAWKASGWRCCTATRTRSLDWTRTRAGHGRWKG